MNDIPTDEVSHPQHYTSGSIETIDVINSICKTDNLTPFEGFLVGNVIKYVSRYKRKNGVIDLRKAVWYLHKLIDVNTPGKE